MSISTVRHTGCGGTVELEWQWWDVWKLWMDMVYCIRCGGPVSSSETYTVELDNDTEIC